MNTEILQQGEVNQKKAFGMIFFLEFWERFGYYSMSAILAFYFVKHLGFTQHEAFNTYGAFVALAYAFTAFGGWVGDKYFGTKRTIIVGASFMLVGYFFMAFSNAHTIFLALGIVAVGSGLFKANPSSLLSKCYNNDASKLDSAFTMYYMAINLGSFFATFFSPIIAAHFGWNVSFLFSGIGMCFALGNFILFRKTVKNINSPGDLRKFSLLRTGIVIIGSLILSVISMQLLLHLTLAHTILWVVVVFLVIAYFVMMFQQKDKGVRLKMLVAFILILEGIIFFTLYMQMSTSVNFYAIYNVKHSMFGLPVNPQSFQSLNPLWIIICSPLLAIWYTKRGNKSKDMKITTKFFVGTALCGIAFTCLYFSQWFGGSTGIVSSWWLVLFYLFQSVGELFVSALGVSMVAQLVPEKFTGFVMGMWFLTSAIAGVTGGWVADLTAPPAGVTGAINTLPIYAHVFLEIGIATFICALIMLAIKPLLNKFI